MTNDDKRTRDELLAQLSERDVEVDELNLENSLLQRNVREWKAKYESAQAKYLKAENRRVELEADAQCIIRDGLNLQLQSLAPRAEILLIYADRASLADQGTFAQVNHMIKNVCKNVKLTIILPENIRLEEMKVEELGKRGLMILPIKEQLDNMTQVIEDYKAYLKKYATYGERTLALRDIAVREFDG